MKKQLFLFLLLAGNVTGNAVKSQVLWTPNLIFGEDFYPSYAIATSTFKVNSYTANTLNASDIKGDLQGQVGIEVHGLSIKDYTVKVQVECEDLAKNSAEEIRVSSKEKRFFFYPHLEYKWEALRKNQQNRPVTAKITVWIDGKLSGTKLKTFSLQSINICPYTCITKSNKMVDLNYMYAAYVNEDNPVIDNVLLKEIFSQGAIKQIAGYQSGDPKDVFQQVFAVWNMLHKRGITYSSLEASAIGETSLPVVRRQYVRTIEDALQSKQANCVDGTVLMASILYRMGIKPVIVVTPSHCFLGYALNSDESLISYLETTMLRYEASSNDVATVKKLPVYDTALAEKFGNAYTSFLTATLVGISNYQKDAEHFNNYSKFIQLSIITDENRNELVNMLQYQSFTVDKFKQQGLQSIFK